MSYAWNKHNCYKSIKLTEQLNFVRIIRQKSGIWYTSFPGPRRFRLHEE